MKRGSPPVRIARMPFAMLKPAITYSAPVHNAASLWSSTGKRLPTASMTRPFSSSRVANEALVSQLCQTARKSLPDEARATDAPSNCTLVVDGATPRSGPSVRAANAGSEQRRNARTSEMESRNMIWLLIRSDDRLRLLSSAAHGRGDVPHRAAERAGPGRRLSVHARPDDCAVHSRL